MLANSADALTISQARNVLAAGFLALEERKQEINDLNVYPVPDGDTGTNLSLTLRGMVETVAKVSPDVGPHELCAAVSQAALMGARGNSGVILSQMVRGAMDVFAQSGALTTEVFARALRHATDTAYRAVRKPVEGTMLTVLRDMAVAAEEAARETSDAAALMEAVIAEGWKSVERTPTLLRVLADAGVVDAGGFGLVVLLEGARKRGEDTVVPIETHSERLAAFQVAEEFEEEGEVSDFAYCTSYLLTGDGLDKERLELELSSLGDSLLVVGDGGRVKIHVHTNEPGKVLAIGTSLGVLSEIEIDNMVEQTQARRRRLSEAERATADTGALELAPDLIEADPGLTQVVAVVAGEGNKRLFRDLGVDFIVEGGQSMNPSTEDLMQAIERTTAPSVVVLPNNGNIIMTADQTARLSDRDIHVVPSRSVQAGLSAAVAYDRRNDGAANARDMQAALDAVVTGEVTRAVRDSQVDGVRVQSGDFIGLVDDSVISASPDLPTVVQSVVSHLLDGRREMLTVLVGDGEEARLALEAVETVRVAHEGVEIDVHHGGQPHYPLLLSAE